MRWTPKVVITLLVRIAGLATALLVVPACFERLVGLAANLGNIARAPSTVFIVSQIASPLVPVSVFAVGVYCFLSGKSVIACLLRGLDDDRHCAHCGYDLSGCKPGETLCPECGHSFRKHL